MAASTNSISLPTIDATSFRLSCKRFLLTYPQCPLSKNQVLQFLQEKFQRKLDWAVVAEEKHQDGSPHLHAFVNLHTRCNYRSASCLDIPSNEASRSGYHPNIKLVTRTPEAVMHYVCKDDNYIAHQIDVTEFLQAKKQKKSTTHVKLHAALVTGSTMQEVALDEELGPVVMMNLTRLTQFQALLQTLEKTKRRQELKNSKISVKPSIGYATPAISSICSWMNLSIRTTRPRKSPQLWIVSEGSAGKSTTIQRLCNAYELSPYYWPKATHWHDAYVDGAYDLIILDEFKSQKTLQEMNSMADGMVTTLPRRSLPDVVKKDNLPLIVCSNQPPADCYPNVYGTSSYDAMLNRFIVVHVPPGEFIRLDFDDNTQSPYDEYDLEYQLELPPTLALSSPNLITPDLTPIHSQAQQELFPLDTHEVVLDDDNFIDELDDYVIPTRKRVRPSRMISHLLDLEAGED